MAGEQLHAKQESVTDVVVSVVHAVSLSIHTIGAGLMAALQRGRNARRRPARRMSVHDTGR
jgi:hypothetical protein